MENFEGNNPPVCFFDSGVGGLNLMAECVRRLPQIDFVYFADNYNVPYGVLTESEILKLTRAKFAEIAALNPAAAVIACNTVTSRCAKYLRAEYSFPIVGIQPAVKPAAEAGGCAVLATPSTAGSAAVRDLIIKYGKGRTTIVACPELASYIENHIFDLDEKEVTSLLPEINTEGIVLGCTHYSLVKDVIGKKYGCPVYDGIDGTARRLCGILGIYDHCGAKTGKIGFVGGDERKNRAVFERIFTP